MDHVAAAQEAAHQRQIQERLQRKMDQVNSTLQSQIKPIQDHINFTLQQAYFKCAYECFDRRRTQAEVGSCVENCSVPVLTAQHHFEDEMARFQERLNRSFIACQDKFEAAKLQTASPEAVNALYSCVDGAIEDNTAVATHLVGRLKASLSIRDEM